MAWRHGALPLPAIAIRKSGGASAIHTIFFIRRPRRHFKGHADAARIDGANEWQVFWHVTRHAKLAPIMMILVVLHAFGFGDGGYRRIPHLRRLQNRLRRLTTGRFHVTQRSRPGYGGRGYAASIGMIGAIA